LSITKKVTAADKSKVYGSADPALTTTDSGFLAADLDVGKITFSASRVAGESVAGGPYTITPAASDGAPSLLGNYDVTIKTGQFAITTKPINVVADDKSKVYGSADPALTVTVPAGELETGDSLSGSLVRAAGNDVGTYAITKGTLTAAGNYDLTVTPATLTITKKAITVKADDKTKVYGSADPALTVTVPAGALESGDSFSGALTRAAGEAVDTCAITQRTLTVGGNYNLTFVSSTLKIVYDWDGFLQPINETAHQTGVQESKFKLGQTIRAKFVLKNAAGAVIRQTTDPTFTRSGNLGTCDNSATTDTTDAVTPDAGVTYTWDGSQYCPASRNLAAGLVSGSS
jgi:hypothetical protein